MGGGNNGIWINASTVNRQQQPKHQRTHFCGLSQQVSVFSLQTLSTYCGGKSLFEFSRKALPEVLFMLL